MNFTINSPLTVTYSVSACEHLDYNGEHTETFDLSGLTSDDLTQYIAQTLIIKRQGMLRSKTAIKDNGAMLDVGNWIVPAPGKRISVSPMKKTQDLLSKLTKEQIKELLEAALLNAE